MTRSTASIRPLPDDVAAQIKSSTTVPSLENVVVELSKNALDAGCRRIDIVVDFSRGACTVEDDGLGISPEEFLDTGGLGKAFHTSKYDGHGRLHGGEGVFLASLAAMSILTITSHHHAHRSSATLILHHTRPAARLVPAPSHYQLLNREHGTKVEVHDLFGNMPVRVKQRGSAYGKNHTIEWEIICRSIVGVLIAWHTPVDTVIRDRNADRKVVLRNKIVNVLESAADSRSLDLPWICSLLSQAGYIEPVDRGTWIKTSARTPFVTIRGAFSLQPAPTKRVQFLSLGIRHLGAEAGTSVLYDEINKLFALSSFGNREDTSDDDGGKRRKIGDRRYKRDGHTNKQLRGGGKGVDRWPMFVIRIELQGNASGRVSGRDALEQDSTLASIVKVLAAMITGFLSDHHFRPRKPRKSRRLLSSSANSSPNMREQGLSTEESADPSSTTTPAVKPLDAQPRFKRTNEKTSAIRSGDTFDDSVRLPNFRADRTQYIQDGFNTWSRIKSSTPRGIEDGFLIEARKGRTSVRCRDPLGDLSTMRPESAQEPFMIAASGAPTTNGQHVSRDIERAQLTKSVILPKPHPEEPEPIHEAEDTITWTNPITKAAMLVNARTGQVLPPPSKRPSSAVDTPINEPTGLANSTIHLTKSERPLSTPSIPQSGSWVSNFLKDWRNPVFSPAAEPSIPQVSFEGPILDSSNVAHKHCSDFNNIDRAFSEASSTKSFAKLSKSGLRGARVIAQVDRKFIVVLMAPVLGDSTDTANKKEKEEILVLVDQHAADERIRVEALLAGLCMAPSNEMLHVTSSMGQKPGVAVTILAKPLTYQIKAQEHGLFMAHARYLAEWGILYDLSCRPPLTAPVKRLAREDQDYRIAVKALPPAIAERCRSEPKLLIDVLRKEVWKRDECRAPSMPVTATSSSSSCSTQIPVASVNNHNDDNKRDWLTRVHNCPHGILDMLNSRACRSAIMFNDVLGIRECETLIKRLAE
ncbi:MAG: hypothetical protein Q9218_005831, partial [Villophora microphyllina]